MFAAAAWWVAIVALWPAGSRPYIGGSQDNSILNLIFGYNGFGRITGNERGSVVGGRVFGATGGLGGGPGNGSGMWGPTGITRLFGAEMGTQISWLLPAALFFLVALLLGHAACAAHRRHARAAVLLWGSWLVVTGLVFSFAQGIIHPYYTVALAPAIGALVGIGVVWAWARREPLASRGSRSPRRSPGPRSGRSCCSTGRRPGIRRFATPCSPAASSAASCSWPRARGSGRGAASAGRVVAARRARSRRSPRRPPTRPRPPRPRTRARFRPPGRRLGQPGRPGRRRLRRRQAGGARAAGPGSRPGVRRRRRVRRPAAPGSRSGGGTGLATGGGSGFGGPGGVARGGAAGSAACSTPARRARRSSRSSRTQPRLPLGRRDRRLRTAPPASSSRRRAR